MAAQQPVLYTVQESLNLLSLDNQVRHFCKSSFTVWIWVAQSVLADIILASAICLAQSPCYMLCTVCMYAFVHSLGLMGLLFLQSLLRGLLPDSFPARLAAEPTTEKQRRFIIIDENVYATYGEQLEQVWWLFYSFPFCMLILSHNQCRLVLVGVLSGTILQLTSHCELYLCYNCGDR